MATGGSGDVLSGVIAALVSQGLSMFDASWLGVFWHGLAGEIARDRHGPAGVIAGDLCSAFRKPGGRSMERKGSYHGSKRCLV